GRRRSARDQGGRHDAGRGAGRRAADAVLRLAARAGAVQRALRLPDGHRARRALAARPGAAARPRPGRPRRARALARAAPARPPARRHRADRGPRARRPPPARMIGRALALGAAAWVGWAWVPHLATVACTWRAPRAGRRLALTFDDGPDPEW